jgi:hypothetical protein
MAASDTPRPCSRMGEFCWLEERMTLAFSPALNCANPRALVLPGWCDVGSAPICHATLLNNGQVLIAGGITDTPDCTG